MTNPTQSSPVSLPRVAITYCTQCRWMLRAAYFGQELLSTFGTQIGEIALIPATGGLFTVELTYDAAALTNAESSGAVEIKKVLLWDRKAEGGFPETKVLKQRVRDHIDPKKDLGHSDVGGKKKAAVATGDDKQDGTADKQTGEKTDEKKVDVAAGQLGGGADEGVELKRNADGTVCEDCA